MFTKFDVSIGSTNFTNNTGKMAASTYDAIVVATGGAYLLEFAKQLKDRRDLTYDQKKQQLKTMYDKLFTRGYCTASDFSKAQHKLTWKGTENSNPVEAFIKNNDSSFKDIVIPNDTTKVDYLGYTVKDTLLKITEL